MSGGDNQMEQRICPKCNKPYSTPPALSRVDNETYICSDCGLMEALVDAGINDDDKTMIIDKVRSMRVSSKQKK